MAKGFLSSAKSYAKNGGKHLWWLLRREERIPEAWDGFKRDTQKLKHTLRKAPPSGNRKKTERILKEGRQAYNAKRYPQAEKLFREAVAEDEGCAWAFTYLGHTLYQQNRPDDALAAWEQAIEVDSGSEAARKARQKIQHVNKRHLKFMRELTNRFRDS